MSEAATTLPADALGSRTPRLITHKDVVGQFARWAVYQHPYGRPEGLFDLTDLIAEASKPWPDGVESLRMWRVSGWQEIERWLQATLKDHPIIIAWNTPRSGHTKNVAVSRHWSTPAEHDFIDIDALLRNVARHVWRHCDE